MDFKSVSEKINENNVLVRDYQIELRQVEPEIPLLSGYEENDWITYLAKQGFFPNHPEYGVLKLQLATKYKKRQDVINSIGYYKTYNLILQQMITFYKDNLKNPTRVEVEDFSKNLGIPEHINKAITEIVGLFL